MSSHALPIVDTLDRQIIHELGRNSAQSLSELGEKFSVGRDVVHYRIKKLENAHIIKGYSAIVDYSKLGLMPAVLEITLRNSTPKEAHRMQHHLAVSFLHSKVSEAHGSFHLLLEFAESSIADIKKKEYDFLMRHGENIESMSLKFLSSLSLFPRDYLIDSRHRSAEKIDISFGSPAPPENGDELIIHELIHDSSVETLALGKKLGLSAAQASYRMQSLEARKIFLRRHAIINISALGRQFFRIRLEPEDFSASWEMLGAISSKNYVSAIFNFVGSNFLEFEAELPGYEEVFKLEKELRAEFGRSLRSFQATMLKA